MDRMMPIIRIDLENVKRSMSHHIADYNGEFNAAVRDALDKTMTEEWVLREIQKQVNESVSNAISKIGDDRGFQRVIRDVITKSLIDAVESKSNA